MSTLRTTACAVVAALASFSSVQGQEPPHDPPNFLVVILDDVGVDMVGAYQEGTGVERTPTLDSLARSGVRFTRAYSSPVCSPTRACVMTGRYGFRTGIGTVEELGGHDLPLDEVTIPEALDATGRGYSHAAIGKWHLSSDLEAGSTAPNEAGFHHFAGALHNVVDYYDWDKTIDGEVVHTDGYITTDNADSAIEWIASRAGPWCCYLAFNAAHTGWSGGRLYQDPPPDLTTYDDEPGRPLPPMQRRYLAILEALDLELGRVLESLPPDVRERTTVLVLGDNGTPGQVTQRPFPMTHGKGTIHEGGIRVPLVVSGYGVAHPGVCDALVHSVDLFATVADLAGLDARELQALLPSGRTLDSVSLVPYLSDPAHASIRRTAFAEWFTPNHDPETSDRILANRAIRDPRYKLIRHEAAVPGCDGKPFVVEELFDLAADPYEQDDLLHGLRPLSATERARLEALRTELDRLLASGP